jgi:hypothetical protein
MASAGGSSVIYIFRALTEGTVWHKMASAERLLVSTHFVTYYYCHPLVSHPTKMNIYIALQNEYCISCLTVVESKRQLTMPHGWRSHKLPSLQADVLKNCDD